MEKTIFFQILAIAVVLLIAYKKQVLEFFRKNKKNFKKITISKGTKKFLKVISAVIIWLILLIGVFFVCNLLFPGGAGYFLGGVIDFVLLCLGAILIIDLL